MKSLCQIKKFANLHSLSESLYDIRFDDNTFLPSSGSVEYRMPYCKCDIFIAKFKKNGTIYLNSNPASAEIMDLRSKSESQNERKFSTSAVR